VNTIKIFIELHWAVERPKLKFRLNSTTVDANMEIVESIGTTEHAIFTLSTQELEEYNVLEVELFDKTDQLNTSETDHWASIKELSVNQVPLDSHFLSDTTFCHHMSPAWVKQMADQGYQILESYTPGSDLRLNGTCYIKIPRSASEYRIMKIWKSHEHTKSFC
jgi:hypothetical protein